MPLELSSFIFTLSLASRITAQSLSEAFISTVTPDFLASIVSSNTIIPETYPEPPAAADINPPLSVSLITISGSVDRTQLPETTPITTTLSAVQPEITFQACNGYPEFCNRRFSNITMVVAHNSPNVVPRNAASNQALGVQAQLNDGIRGLHVGTYFVASILRLCHTSCHLLDAGPLETYLHTVSLWLSKHPYEVVALILNNHSRVPLTYFVGPFARAGLLKYVYIPTAPSYTLDNWPTLGAMISNNTRLVVYIDYLPGRNDSKDQVQRDEESVPWILPEFAYQWETPFSPTDPAFPCTVSRPPELAVPAQAEHAANVMYLANHNLNIAVPIPPTLRPRPSSPKTKPSPATNSSTLDILIPAYTILDQVNAASGYASLGLMVEQCTAHWGRPPNMLLVDYYHVGHPTQGSVFAVAAKANGVPWRGRCCGDGKGLANGGMGRGRAGWGVRSLNATVAGGYMGLVGLVAFWALV